MNISTMQTTRIALEDLARDAPELLLLKMTCERQKAKLAMMIESLAWAPAHIALNPLLAYAEHKSAWIRDSAALALGVFWHHPGAEMALRQLADDPDEQVRNTAMAEIDYARMLE